jgi:hypothetical protein
MFDELSQAIRILPRKDKTREDGPDQRDVLLLLLHWRWM